MAQATANGQTEEQTQADLNERTHLVITVPLGLKIELDKRAATDQLSTSALVRKLVADQMDYELPATATRRAKKYATEEERIAAQTQRRKERNALFTALLEKYRKGEIKLDAQELEAAVAAE